MGAGPHRSIKKNSKGWVSIYCRQVDGGEPCPNKLKRCPKHFYCVWYFTLFEYNFECLWV